MLRIVERRVPEGEDGIADELVDRRLAGEQDVTHRREETDQEANDFLRPKRFRYSRKTAHIGEQHGHLPLFSTKFKLARIGGDAADQFGRKIAVKSAVDIAAAALLKVKGQHGLGEIDRQHGNQRIGRIKQEVLALKGEPRAAHHHASKQQTKGCALSCTKPRQQQ